MKGKIWGLLRVHKRQDVGCLGIILCDSDTSQILFGQFLYFPFQITYIILVQEAFKRSLLHLPYCDSDTSQIQFLYFPFQFTYVILVQEDCLHSSGACSTYRIGGNIWRIICWKLKALDGIPRGYVRFHTASRQRLCARSSCIYQKGSNLQFSGKNSAACNNGTILYCHGI